MNARRHIRDLALAFTLLTGLPLQISWPSDSEGKPDVASWFPAVGLALGALWLGVLFVAMRISYGIPGTLAAVVLIATAALTRLLHWDGLADVADAWFSAPERRWDVMHDSRTGPFGVVAVVLAALLQWTALVELGESLSTLPLVVVAPVFGRLAASFAAWLGTPARTRGLGASIVRRPSAVGATGAFVAVAAALALSLWAGSDPVATAVVAGAGLLLSAAVPHVVAQRLGGVSGDVMGASVLCVETTVLVAAVWVPGVLRLAGVGA